MDEPKCDFCSTRPVAWEIPCADFTVPGTYNKSTGAFLACDPCGALVRAGDRDGLQRRAQAMLGRSRAFISPTHIGFWQHGRPDEIKRLKTYTVDEMARALSGPTTAPPVFPPPPDRPWMEAIEVQFRAVRILQGQRPDDVDDFVRDLARATTYGWTETPIRAVTEAAKTIPDSATLPATLLPAETGFWWLGPYPDDFSALFWSIRNGLIVGGEAEGHQPLPTLYLSRFAQLHWPRQNDIKRPMLRDLIIWPLDRSIEQAGRVTTFLNDEKRPLLDPLTPMPLSSSDDVPPAPADVLDAMRFFLAGCVWLQQKILVTSEGHVERHRRKQLAREHHVPPPADVKIIELRRKESVRSGPAPTDGTPVEWSCQWVVSGHWTHQAHGPKHGERRLQYILPYVKGPDDKPLRVPSHTVYQVDR
jgi:hypothetical protein